MTNDYSDDTAFAPDWEAFEAEIGSVPRLFGDIPQIEATFGGFAGTLISRYSFDPPAGSASSSDVEIPATASTPAIPVRIYQPAVSPDESPPNKDKPVIVFFHGGGWCVGDLNTDDLDARAIATRSGMVVVSVEYRLAPKNPYPAGLDDCVAATKWVLSSDLVKSTVREGANNGIILTGLSAGGNLAFGTALRLIDDSPSLTRLVHGILAQVPVTVDPDQVPKDVASRLGPHTSYVHHRNDTINTASAMRSFAAAYAAPPGDKYTNIILHPRLASLPPTVITAAGMDTLVDDSRLLYGRLKEEGVSSRLHIQHGYPHYYWTFPAPVLKEAIEKYRVLIDDSLAWLLRQRRENSVL